MCEKCDDLFRNGGTLVIRPASELDALRSEVARHRDMVTQAIDKLVRADREIDRLQDELAEACRGREAAANEAMALRAELEARRG